VTVKAEEKLLGSLGPTLGKSLVGPLETKKKKNTNHRSVAAAFGGGGGNLKKELEVKST